METFWHMRQRYDLHKNFDRILRVVLSNLHTPIHMRWWYVQHYFLMCSPIPFADSDCSERCGCGYLYVNQAIGLGLLGDVVMATCAY